MRVLSIDGGGIRGLIPAIVLAEVERRCERPVAELFDLIAGTSTGGIIACALAMPGPDGKPAHSAARVADIYIKEGPKIFHRSLRKQITSLGGYLDERYDDDALNDALDRWLGDTRLEQALTDVFITAYDIKDRFAFFFRSSRARTDPTYDFRMAHAARATSAAPSYFEPVAVTDVAGSRTYPLIDGGVYATNPAMCAFAEVAGMGRFDELEVILSLGTGELTKPYTVERARRWGQVQWVRPVIDIVFDGIADTVEFEAETLLRKRYVRLQQELCEASDAMDNASERNLARLANEAKRILDRHSQDLDRVCEQLVA